ncbi:MAG TPA: hypothetical protein VGO52_21420 [Hyphomonadaceae bacterium]|nr:hypothetical protein [Hyphomonadaceae bacterium]
MFAAFARSCRLLAAGLLGAALLVAAADAQGVANQGVHNVAEADFHIGDIPVKLFSNASDLPILPASAAFTASGYVFDVRTGAAMDEILVMLVDKSGRTIQSATTGGATSTQSVDEKRSASHTSRRGIYSFKSTRNGRYRLAFELPLGWRVATGATTAKVRTFVTPEGRSVVLVAGSFGREFDVTGGGAIAIDVPLEPDYPRLTLEKTTTNTDVSEGDIVSYSVRIANDSGAGVGRDLVLTDTPPRGFRFVSGSLRINDAQAADPQIDGSAETFRVPLPDLPAGDELNVTYRMRVGPDARMGDGVNQASVAGALDYASNKAQAIVKVRSAFLDDRITIVGRVAAGSCDIPSEKLSGLSGVRVVMEDGTWALTDKQGLYHFEGVRPGVHVVQLDAASLPEGSKPVSCGKDIRKAGSAISQFIDAPGGAIVRADFLASPPQTLRTDLLEFQPAPVVGAPPTALSKEQKLFAGPSTGAGWILPKADANPDAPALHVAIGHGVGAKVALRVNGQTVPAATFEGALASADGNYDISQWRGVVIKDGDNTLEADVTTADGAVTTLKRTVHYANAPAKAVLVSEQSKLVADGVSRPVVAVRILDASGKPVRKGVTGGVRVVTPYKLASETAAQQQRQLAGTERFDPVYRVTTDDGIALIELDPATQAGWADLKFEFPAAIKSNPEPVRAWLSASRKDWIIVGYAAGTVGFNTLADNAEALPGAKEKTFTEGETAFYAKGRIKGEWLLTLAYDTGKKTDDATLLGAIDPDRFYSLYGDASSQGHDAPSSKKLYLRLDRGQFYAMFGDFQTGLGDTQLANFNRTLTGVKLERAGKVLTFSAFAADTAQHEKRDEIQGNGLSGSYRLSSADIIANTDRIRIEVRDRYRSERIVSAKALSRHIDYEIDYASSTLLFRVPVLSKDADFNPIYIVADYETFGAASSDLTAGGRASAKLFNGKVKLGLTAVSEETSGNTRQFSGVDAVVQLNEQSTLRVEAANSDAGGAFVAELQHGSETSELLAYYRQQAEGFGLGQGPSGQGGTYKTGIDVRQKFGKEVSVAGTAYYEGSLKDQSERTYGDVRLERRDEGRTVFGGVRLIDETGATGVTKTTTAMIAGATQALLDNKLEVSVSTDIKIAGDDNDTYPGRVRLGARYQVMDGVRLVGSHEFSLGDTGAETSQVGFEVEPWAGARLASTLNQTSIRELGARTFAQFGMSQSLPIGEHWTVDASFDGARPVGGAASSASTPSFASKGPDQRFSAVTGGATYRDDEWSWNTRLEMRDANSDERFGVISNVIRQLNETTSLAAAARAFRQTDADGFAADLAEGRLAAVARDPDSAWTVFDKATLRHEAREKEDAESSRLINDLGLSFDDDHRNSWRGSMHYGAKYVTERMANDDADGFIHALSGDIAYGIFESLDIGLQLGMRQADGSMSYSAGPALGWSPVENAWFSFGYNIVGYEDRDFAGASYTRQGVYAAFRIKFDQTTVGGITEFLEGRSS